MDSYYLMRTLDSVYPIVALVLAIVFLFGVGEYLVTRYMKVNSRVGMRIIVASVLILLLVTGIYVLIGTVVGVTSESHTT